MIFGLNPCYVLWVTLFYDEMRHVVCDDGQYQQYPAPHCVYTISMLFFALDKFVIAAINKDHVTSLQSCPMSESVQRLSAPALGAQANTHLFIPLSISTVPLAFIHLFLPSIINHLPPSFQHGYEPDIH